MVSLLVGQGADLIAGSLIKNPGGTVAPCGGYVAGRKKWVDAAAARLSAPGLGVDCGSTPGDIMRAFFQGLFLAPQMVGEAIKVHSAVHGPLIFYLFPFTPIMWQ